MHCLDLRSLTEVAARQALAAWAGEPVLVKSRRPCADPSLVVPLVTGPSAFYWAVLPPRPRIPWQDELLQQYQALLQGYHPIIAAAQAGERSCLEIASLYAERLRTHMEEDEGRLFPAVDEFLGDPRFTRELRYEHQGLRAGLVSLPGLLEQCLTGQATRKQVEKQELDLFHLLEHHLEREQAGLVPLLPFIAK